jgi:hypothetical protein
VAFAAVIPAIRFTDVTGPAGLNFRHRIGDTNLDSLVESTGIGCAFLDYDNDGWMDLYLIGGGYVAGLSDPTPPSDAIHAATDRLFRNRGNGTFEDVTARAGILAGGYGIGVLAGDYDNDGATDLYVTQYGTNRLYHNQGNRTFTECALAAGVAETGFSVGACFLDYDCDGRLDLFVGKYVDYDPIYNRHHAQPNHFPGPLAFPPTLSQLYRNLGQGRFTKVTRAAGILSPGRAMGVGSFDYNEDGWPDVFVSNDAMENHLLQNRRNGTFEEVGLSAGVALGAMGEVTSAMAVETGDVNGDGHPDLYVPDFQQSCLYLNAGKGFFDTRTLPSGIAKVVGDRIQWGAVLADFDLDRDLDLYVSRGDANSMAGYPDRVLANDGGARFTDVSGAAGPWFGQAQLGRGVARGDFDNDGRIDLLVAHLNAAPVLLRNVSEVAGHHWLMLRLVGHGSNRDAVGARLRFILGNQVLVRERVSAGSYCCSHDPRVHCGLGPHPLVPRLEVRWPNGRIQVLTDIKADQILTVHEPLP